MMQIDLTKKYALAVSGGIDSMVMLHRFAALCPRPDFFVVTVNHGIRAEAQTDCDFVKRYCDKLGVACKTVAVDVPTYARDSRLSEETAARILRYNVLDGLDCDYVCLAHHQGDNAETVLMHMLRGSGSYGAEGIRRVNGKYIRPLLDLSRDDIVRYAQENNIPYVTDSTNNDTKYTRNYIRKVILPELKKLNPSAEQNIVRFAENISADNEYLDSLADVSTVEFNGNQARIPLSLTASPKPVAYRILRKVFRQIGVYHDIERTHIEALLALSRAQGGKSISLPFGYTAVNDYDYLTIIVNESNSMDDFEILFKTGETVTPLGKINVSRIPSNCGKVLKFDLAAIPDGAVFRNRRSGDVFRKFGGGSKPLRKYLIDKKIPERYRDKLPLVAKENEILIVCGVEIAETVKVTESSDVYYVWICEDNI